MLAVSLCLTLYVCVFVSAFVSVPVSLCISLSHSFIVATLSCHCWGMFVYPRLIALDSLSACLSVYLSVYVSVCLTVCLSVCRDLRQVGEIDASRAATADCCALFLHCQSLLCKVMYHTHTHIYTIVNLYSDVRHCSNVSKIGFTCSVSHKKFSPMVSLKFFPKRFGIFNQFFTHLLYDHFYTRLHIFIQMSPTLTKLCHTKRDHLANFYISQELLSLLTEQMTSLLPQTTINKAINDLHERDNACVSADGGHFEHIMWTG